MSGEYLNQIKKLNINKQYEKTLKINITELNEYIPVKRNSISIINSTEKNLITELLPLKHKRMATDIFSFYRGTVALMSSDLKKQNNSNIPVVLCGDAHISNFGFFASPERQLLFDLNDFDEAHIGSFEDDLRRFLVSVYLAGKLNGLSKKRLDKLVRIASKSYRNGISYASSLNCADRYFFSSNVKTLIKDFFDIKHPKKVTKSFLSKIKKQSLEAAISKYTELGDNGKRHFVDNAPRTIHVDEELVDEIASISEKYCNTVREDTRLYLSQYHVVDIVRHSVGVGSFGTRCYLALLHGTTDNSYLILQVKEALPRKNDLSKIGDRVPIFKEISAGKRIVASQRILQSASDPLLGSFTGEDRSYYVRQFRDMKGSVILKKLDWESFKYYVQTCGFLLAMAHSQSPTFDLISNYFENVHNFDKDILSWTIDYSAQVNRDFQTFKKWLKDNKS